MNKELDLKFIKFQSEQAKSIANIAELVSNAAEAYSGALAQYIEIEDKHQAALYVKMCNDNLVGSIYQFNCAIEMLNCNSYATWNIISEHIKNDEQSINFGSISDISVRSADASETNNDSDIESISEIVAPVEVDSPEVIINEVVVTDEVVVAPVEVDSPEVIISNSAANVEVVVAPVEVDSPEVIINEVIVAPVEVDSPEVIPKQTTAEEDIANAYVVAPITYKKILEPSKIIAKKYFDPNEPDREIYISRLVDIEKLIKYHNGMYDGNVEYNSTFKFREWCWNEHWATFKWNCEKGIISITAPSKQIINKCLFEIAFIFEHI